MRQFGCAPLCGYGLNEDDRLQHRMTGINTSIDGPADGKGQDCLFTR